MDQQAFVAGYNFQKKAFFKGLSPERSALYTGLAAAPLGGALGYFTAGEKESPWKKALYYGLISGAAGGLAGAYLPGIFGTVKKMKEQKTFELTPEQHAEYQREVDKTGVSMQEIIRKENEQIKELRSFQEKLKDQPSDPFFEWGEELSKFKGMTGQELRSIAKMPKVQRNTYLNEMLNQSWKSQGQREKFNKTLKMAKKLLPWEWELPWE